MASSGVSIGYGTTVRVGRRSGVGGATITWTALTGLEDINFPMNETDEIEVSHMGSPNRTKEYISGLTDNGEVTITTHWVPGSAQDVLMLDLRSTGEAVLLEFTPANPAPGVAVEDVVEVYDGFLKAYSRNAPVQEAMTAEATFRINGLVTLP